MAGDIVGMVPQLTQEAWCHLFIEHYNDIFLLYMEMSPELHGLLIPLVPGNLGDVESVVQPPIVVAPITLIL